MTNQKDNFLWFKFNGLLRQFIIRGGVRLFWNHYTVNEHPKSGGSWLGQMIAEGIKLPFPRNKFPLFTDSIMQGHYLSPWNMKNVVVIWRDGRDVLISQYYHSLFFNKDDKMNNKLVEISRKHFKCTDYHDIESNLPRFIEYLYKTKIEPRFSWSDFVQNWTDVPCVHVTYEALRINTANELKRIIQELTGDQMSIENAAAIADKYSFEKQSGRKAGEEDKSSFMRKGIVGDWKNYFTKEANEIFDYYAGDSLIKLGYEKNHDWIYEGIKSI